MADHDAHAAAGEPPDESIPDEQKTPLWLTALGGALFLLLVIGWLAARASEPDDAQAAQGVASASASVAAPTPPPPPAPIPPTPPPIPPPAVAAAPAASRPAVPMLPRPPRARGKGVKP
jgi:hypothetical protein